MSNYRNRYFDYLRGIAIMMVVGIHTYPGGHILGTNFIDDIKLVIINVFNCAVPLFLAISGYFIAQKSLNNIEEYKFYYRKQIPQIYIPCLLFSLPWFIISCISVNSWGG